MKDHGDIFDALLDPTNDRAWKIALGEAVRTLSDHVERTNGRILALERFKYAMGGGLAVVTAICVPLFLRAVGA